jgi:hypothetical protein
MKRSFLALLPTLLLLFPCQVGALTMLLVAVFSFSSTQLEIMKINKINKAQQDEVEKMQGEWYGWEEQTAREGAWRVGVEGRGGK